jgi:DnaK suppressor protein
MPASPKKAPQKGAQPALIGGIKPYKPKKGEKYMSKQQLAHFRNILETWREELIAEVSRTVHAMQDDTVNHPDPNDRASQETDMSLELRSRDRERKLLKKIDEALAEIDSGEYGYCEKCGIEIGIQRLEARPTATLCIDCKTLDEIRERQQA